MIREILEEEINEALKNKYQKDVEKYLKGEVQVMKKYSYLLSDEFFLKFKGINKKIVETFSYRHIQGGKDWATPISIYVQEIKDLYQLVWSELREVKYESSLLDYKLNELKEKASNRSLNFNVYATIKDINDDGIYSK